MEIRKVKDLVKLIKYSKEPAAFYLDYMSGNKYKHILWKYDDFNSLLAHVENDLYEKGIIIKDKDGYVTESIVIESVDVCMNLLDSKRFIKVFAAERSVVD